MISLRFIVSYEIFIMSTLLLSILGLSIGAQQCTQWKEIAPCTCIKDTSIIIVSCDKMSSYAEIVNTLQNKFQRTDRIELRIGFSILEDLSQRSFKELDLNIEKLQLHHDNLSELSVYSFLGLTNLNLLSLADNSIGIVPEHVLAAVPNVKTLDLGRIGIRQLVDYNFKNVPYVQNILLGGNLISQMEINSIPTNIRQLHLGRNRIKDLNGTLINLSDLEWVFINANELTTLENQLPIIAPRLVMIHAAYNKIEKLPQHLKTYTNLHSLFIHNNRLTSLDGILSKLRKLERAPFEHNRINVLTKEDFLETESLQCLCMGNNFITSLNNSLSPLRSLGVLNMTHNLLTQFSLQEIKGLQKLRTVDLSFNKINKLTGPAANLVEWETRLVELILNNNEIDLLNGALAGLPTLTKLNLSHNKIIHISPDDLIGLDRLQLLDISHNKLTTLEETGKSFLPSLNELVASYNQLSILDHDFHGLPVLCWADLSNNKIVALGRDLVSKTRCKVEDTEGTLKVLLQDNPILCDAALPEIVAAMEINHTRISGVSHCGPLSEQPTTSKPNAFYGLIPEELYNQESSESTNLFNGNPLFKHHEYQVEPQSNGQDKLLSIQNSLLSANIPIDTISLQNNTTIIEPINLPSIKNVERENFDNLNSSQITHFDNNTSINSLQSEANNLVDYTTTTAKATPSAANDRNELLNQNIEDSSLPKNYYNTENVEEKYEELSKPVEQLSKDAIFEPNKLNEPTIIANVDPAAQQDQLNQLATQIEELRLKVQELTVQNKMLSNTMNQDISVTNLLESNITNELKNVTKQIIIHALPSEESPEKDEEVVTS